MLTYLKSKFYQIRKYVYTKYMFLVIAHKWKKPLCVLDITNPYTHHHQDIVKNTISVCVFKFKNLTWAHPVQKLNDYSIPLSGVFYVPTGNSKLEAAICVDELIYLSDHNIFEAATLHEAGHIIVDIYFPELAKSDNYIGMEIAADSLAWREGRAASLSKLLASMVTSIEHDDQLIHICNMLKIRCILAILYLTPKSEWDETDVKIIEIHKDILDKLEITYKD